MSLTLAALAALGSIGSSIYGAVTGAQANAEAKRKLEEDRAEDRRYYARLLNRDYVNSSENRTLLQRMQEMQRKNYDRARAINTVAGGTDATLSALQQQGNEMMVQTAQGIAARADAYKDRAGAAKRASEKDYANRMFALEQQRAQGIAQAAGQVSSAMAGIASAAGSAENPFGIPAAAEEVVAPAAVQPVVDAENIKKTQELLAAYRAAGYDPSIFGLGGTALMYGK